MTSPARFTASYGEAAPATQPVGASSLAMHRVKSREDWAIVRALRYEALLARGDIAHDVVDAMGDSHDLAFNACTFLLTRHGRPLGSTRSSVSSADRRWPLPA